MSEVKKGESKKTDEKAPQIWLDMFSFLLSYMKAGKASPTVLAEIESLEAQVKELRATPATLPKPFSLADVWLRFGGKLKVQSLLLEGRNHETRLALTALGIEKVIVRPDGKRWQFEGSVNLDIRALHGDEVPSASSRPWPLAKDRLAGSRRTRRRSGSRIRLPQKSTKIIQKSSA